MGPDDVEKLLHTGPMFIVERGVEPAQSHAEIMVYALAENLIRLGYATKDAGQVISTKSVIGTEEIYEALTVRYYDDFRHLQPEFTILNVADGFLNTVGTSISGAVDVTGEIVFPGDTETVPRNS